MTMNLKRWSIAILFLTLLLVYGIPIIAGKSLFNAKWLDSAISHWLAAPLASLIHQSLFQGVFPLWNPLNGTGAPLAVEIQAGLYTPFHWLAFLYPSPTTWDIIFLLRLFISGIGVYLFLKACQVRYWIACYTAILYMFSGHLFYFGNAWHINSLSLTPLLFFGLQKLFTKRNINSAIIVITLSWCFMITGGGLIDVLLVGILTVLIVLLYLVLNRFEPLKDRIFKSFYIAALLVLGTVMAGIFLIPFFELRELSVSLWGGRSTANFNSWSYFLSLFFHKVTLTPSNHSHYYMNFRQYLNILILPGILSLVLYYRRGISSHKIWISAFGIFTFCYFGKLYGISGLQIFNELPLLKEIRFEKYVGTAYLTIYFMAGLGYEWMMRNESKNIFRIIGIGLGTGLLPMIYIFNEYRELTEKMVIISFIYGGIVLLFCYLLAQYKRNKKQLVILMLYIVVFTSIYFDIQKDFLGSVPKILKIPDQYSWLKNNFSEKNTRIFESNIEIPPKMLAQYNLYDIRDYSDSLQKRYFELFKTHVLKGRSGNIYVLTSDKYKEWNHNLLSFLSVEYFFVNPNISPISSNIKTEYP